MSKWLTQEGMNEIMSIKGINRIRLLFDEVFPNALPVENATYGRLNKDSSIAILTIKVNDDVLVHTEGDDSDLITICGINFNWTFFRFNINTEVNSLSEHEREAIRNLWAYTGALMKAYSLILAHHQAIGYDALDRIHRVLMIVGQVLRSYLNLNSVKQEAYAEFKKLTNRWSVHDLCLFETILGRYVVDNEGIAMREIYPERTTTVLVDIKKHAVDENIIVIEDHASGNKPIVKVIDLKMSYTYINDQLNDLIEKCELDASKVKLPLASITKGMLLCHLFQDIDTTGKHGGLSNIKNKMSRHFACGHLDVIKPTLVRISEKASRLATEVKP